MKWISGLAFWLCASCQTSTPLNDFKDLTADFEAYFKKMRFLEPDGTNDRKLSEKLGCPRYEQTCPYGPWKGTLEVYAENQDVFAGLVTNKVEAKLRFLVGSADYSTLDNRRIVAKAIVSVSIPDVEIQKERDRVCSGGDAKGLFIYEVRLLSFTSESFSKTSGGIQETLGIVGANGQGDSTAQKKYERIAYSGVYLADLCKLKNDLIPEQAASVIQFGARGEAEHTSFDRVKFIRTLKGASVGERWKIMLNESTRRLPPLLSPTR